MEKVSYFLIGSGIGAIALGFISRIGTEVIGNGASYFIPNEKALFTLGIILIVVGFIAFLNKDY